jgi:hypothetical protein
MKERAPRHLYIQSLLITYTFIGEHAYLITLFVTYHLAWRVTR